MIGRLKVSVTIGQAEAELQAIDARIIRAEPETRDESVRLIPLRHHLVRDEQQGLILLLGAVGVVLLVACVNVANLLLIKATATHKETAVQLALGASAWHVRQRMLIESALLGGMGVLAGLVLASSGVKALTALGPQDVPLLSGARVDLYVLVFTLAVAVAATVFFGTMPSLRAASTDVAEVLRQGSRHQGRGERRVIRTLAVTQVVLAMVLLITGSLLLRSFRALRQVDLGFEPAGIMTFKIELPRATTYVTQESRDQFFAGLLDSIRSVPGLRGVTMADAPAIEFQPNERALRVIGQEEGFRVNVRVAEPGYFELLGIPLLSGRIMLPSDRRDAPIIALVSRSAARAIWGSRDPLGARLVRPQGDTAEVVGIVGDVRTTGFDGAPSRTIYLPARQTTFNFMTILMKSADNPEDLVAPAARIVGDLDHDLPLYQIRSLDDLVSGSIAQQRFLAAILGGFSLLVFSLAILGVYGVISFMVSERTAELGIRMALGATSGSIIGLVVSEGARLAFVGAALGLVLASIASLLLDRFRFGISALDPVSFLVVPAILIAAVLCASWIPALRAGKTDPMRVLRGE